MSVDADWEWVLEIDVKGGPGSGHWGHAGRPGQRGGSQSSKARYTRDSLSFSSGGDMLGSEYQGYLLAKDPTADKVIGRIDWTYYQGETSIRMIEVDPEYRRRGVGQALIEELKDREGITDLGMVGNFATEEGRAFFGKVAPEVLSGRDIQRQADKVNWGQLKTEYGNVIQQIEGLVQQYPPIGRPGHIQAKIERLGDRLNEINDLAYEYDVSIEL